MALIINNEPPKYGAVGGKRHNPNRYELTGSYHTINDTEPTIYRLKVYNMSNDPNTEIAVIQSPYLITLVFELIAYLSVKFDLSTYLKGEFTRGIETIDQPTAEERSRLVYSVIEVDDQGNETQLTKTGEGDQSLEDLEKYAYNMALNTIDSDLDVQGFVVNSDDIPLMGLDI